MGEGMKKSNMPDSQPVGGTITTYSNRQRFAVYDKLPKKIKQELMYGEVNWCAISVLKNRRKQKFSIDNAVTNLKAMNRKYWAYHYPELEDTNGN